MQDDSIALRIKFADKAPSGSEIYLRGPVLSAFDGREWLPRTELPSEKSEQSNLRVTGEPIRYEATLEPQNKAWVFVLDAASKPPLLPNYGLSLNADMQWTANRPITELVRYQAQSHLQFTHGPAQWDGNLDTYVALPTGSNPRTRQMAEAIKQNAMQANALWRYCRGGVDTHPSANLCGGINLPNFSPRMGVTLTHHPSAIDGVGFTALVACDQPCWHPHGAHQDDEGRSDVFTKACLLVKPKLVGAARSLQTGLKAVLIATRAPGGHRAPASGRRKPRPPRPS